MGPATNSPPPAERKLLPISSLAELIASRRADGLTVAHCHGVFDPIHLGHIQHFREAKKLADLLVVTVTPDRFVNKGPHRPVFPQELRAAAIAEVEAVDFVAVNEWPTAVEAIQTLKPNIYVKGEEFRQRSDLTGALAVEEAAVIAAGGRIEFTGGPVFSASHLVNQILPVFPAETGAFLADFSRRFPLSTILSYLERARTLKVLVVGDAIIDEYQFCDAIGKSSKEPTLVVRKAQLEQYAGGAFAVANHVAGFCDRVELKTILGDSPSREDFIRKALRSNVVSQFTVRPGSPTIVKRRYVEQYFGNKLFEVYEINDDQLDDSVNTAWRESLRERVGEFDVVLVMDYGHGTLSSSAVKLLTDEARFLIVNTQSNAGNLGYHAISTYGRADFVAIAENELRLEARDRRADVRQLIEQLSRRVRAPRIIVTRGKNGCLCFDAEQGFVAVPAFAGQIVDRIGAGDAFLSISGLFVAQGAPLELAGFAGNVAGAEAVASMGHRESIRKTTFARHIEHLLK